jgi:hypothetical protein
MTSTVLLKYGKNDGIAVYVPKELFRRRWQPKLSKLSHHFFFDLVQEFSDSTSYFKVTGFWDVLPCNLVSRYQYFGGTCYLHF